MQTKIMVIWNPKIKKDGITMSTGIDFNRFAQTGFATLALAATMALLPLKDAFGQKVGDTYTVPQAKEVIYKGQNQVPIMAVRQALLSKESTRGNPIYVLRELIITSSPDGKSGYELQGNGHDFRESDRFRVYGDFSGGVSVYDGITSVKQLPVIKRISSESQKKREEVAAHYFELGYEYRIHGVSADGGHCEYFTRSDNEGGSVQSLIVRADGKVVTGLSGDAFLILPGYENVKKTRAPVVVTAAKYPSSGVGAIAARID